MLQKKLKLPISEFPRGGTFRFRADHISLKTAHNTLEHSRFGISVSKKTSPKAATRNWVKRTLFEGLKDQMDKVSPNMDLLVVVASPIIETTPEVKVALLRELREGLDKLAN